MHDTYAHAISRIDFMDGIVRLELAIAKPNGSGGLELETTQAVHVPLGGFLRSAETIERFLRDLSSRGIIKLGDTEPSPPVETPRTNFGG